MEQKIRRTTMRKCLSNQKNLGKNRLDAKQICRKKLGFKDKI